MCIIVDVGSRNAIGAIGVAPKRLDKIRIVVREDAISGVEIDHARGQDIAGNDIGMVVVVHVGNCKAYGGVVFGAEALWWGSELALAVVEVDPALGNRTARDDVEATQAIEIGHGDASDSAVR